MRKFYRILFAGGLSILSAICFWFIMPQPWHKQFTPITEAPLITEAPITLKGDLIFDTPNGKLWRQPLNNSSEKLLGEREIFLSIPAGTFAFQPVWSPDNSQIAYGYLAKSENGLQSANIWRVNADGTKAQPVTQPLADFTGSYRDPTWTPDGRSIWMTAAIPKPDAESGIIHIHQEIRRVMIEGNPTDSRETVMVANGHAPALANDGIHFAYLAPDDSDRDAIWLGKMIGQAAQVLVSGHQFETIYAPMRFSPDSQLLAFAAADLPQYTQQSHQPLVDFYRLFQSPILYAHGLYPADVWIVEVVTGQLTRLTQLAEDHPSPVWSSDGRHLFFAGVLGIYVIDVERQSAVRLTEQGIDGQIDWADTP